MDREEGMDVLGRGAWLSNTPVDFRDALLSQCRWQSLEPSALIQQGGDAYGEMTGLARGIIEFRTVLGRADTPVMHFARPVFWIGYSSIVVPRRAHRVEAVAKTTVWLARAPQAAVRKLLDERPEWWQYFLRPAFFYGDLGYHVAADLMIGDGERRCAAVLLRLSGRHFVDNEGSEAGEVAITQEDLAGAANLSRTSIRRMLGRLAERGLIEQGYRGIVVRAPAALRASSTRDESGQQGRLRSRRLRRSGSGGRGRPSANRILSALPPPTGLVFE